MKTEETPEIIEIIDDDVDMFGDRATNTTMYDTGGPRWIGPVAAVALIAIIGYGIATSASTSSVPKVAPAPTTTAGAPTTTQPAPTTTEVPKPLVPFYAAAPPRQLTVEFADTQLPDPNFNGLGSYQLWATEDASATAGSWFSLEMYPGGVSNVYAIDAYRVQTDQMSIAISHLPTGHTMAQFVPKGKPTVTMTSFGLADDAVIRLAQSIDIVRSHVQFTDRAPIADYRLLSTVHPWYSLQGNPAEQIYYSDGNDPIGGFAIIVSPRSASDPGSSTLDRQTAQRFFLDGATTFDVDGHVGVAGEVIGQPGYVMATWIAGDHIVTVAGTRPAPDLISIAQTVHEVSPEEWAGMQFQATRHNADNNFGNFEQTNPIPISFGIDANSKPWKVEVALATFGDQQESSWQWDNSGYSTRTEDTPKISTVVDNERTYVLADLPRAIAPTAQLQILRDGLEPVLVPFSDTDPTFDRTFSAYAFSEPVPYTAQIVGPDGALIAYWPSP